MDGSFLSKFESFWGFVSRTLLWTAFSLLLLAAVYVSVGRMILGGMSGFKTTLENSLSRSLKAEVSINAIEGEFIGLDPNIRISGLTIAASGGGPVTGIESISIAVDTIATLQNIALSLGRLEVHGVRTSVIQLESGGWKIAGFPRRDAPVDPAPMVGFLTNIESLTVSDVEVSLQTLTNNFRVYLGAGNNIELTTEDGLRKIATTLGYHLDQPGSVQPETGSIDLIGFFKGNPLTDHEFFSRAYIQMSPIPLPELLPAVRVKDLNLHTLLVGGRFWLEYERGELQLQGELTVPSVSYSQDGNRHELITDLLTSFQLHAVGLWDWQLIASDVRFSHDGEEKNIDDLKVASFIENNQRNVLASLGKLDVGSLADSLLKLSENSDILSVWARSLVAAAQPQGVLENVHLKLLLDENPIDARLVARISNGNTKAYLGSPALSSLNGFVSAGLRNGWIDIDSRDLKVRFAHAFKDDWHFDSATGRLKYEYVPGLLKLSSDLIVLSEKGMTVNGSFHLNLPRDSSAKTWGLVIGITHADLSEKRRYLPFTISDAAYDWLDSAIVSGHVIDSGLMLHGALSKQALSIEKTYELYFNVEDVNLDYHPSWPQLSEMVGVVYLGNWGVTATGMAARIFNSQITTADVAVPFDRDGKVSVVEILAELTGSGSDGVRFLNETPLVDQVNNLAEDWLVKGDISVTADLVIPIAEAVPSSAAGAGEPQSSINIVMNGNEILMPSYDILLQDIKGELSYSVKEGLQSQGFTARLFGGPLHGTITTVMGELGEVTISADGSTTVKDLYDWSEQTMLTRATGPFDYWAKLTFPFGSHVNSSSVEARSNLVGVHVDLPLPLGKTADESVNFRYLNTFGDPVQRVEVDYGEQFSAILLLNDAKIVAASVNFGEQKAEVPEGSGVIVKGTLAEVRLEQWQSLIDDLQSKYLALSDVSLQAEMLRSVELIDLEIGKLHAFGSEWIDVSSQVRRGDHLWEIDISNPVLSGRFKLPDETDQPLIVDLDYIRIESDESDGDVADPLVHVEPKLLGAVVFSTDEFSWNGENYGAWSFVFNSTDDGARLTSLSAQVKGLNIISSAEGEQQSSITWIKTEEEHSSHFEGFVQSSDLAKVLREWGFASSIESQDVRFNAQLDWMGSPAMLSYKTVTGSVDLETGEGRFVQVQPGSGALRLLGIFDFASIARRFRFDFSDIVDSGFQFDEIKGKAFLEDGVIKVIEPIEIDSPSSIVKVGGEVNLITREVDSDMVLTLPVSRNLPWFAAIASGPLFGAGVFLAQKILLDEPIKQFSSAKYKISGSIDEPEIEFISIFDNSVRKRDELDRAEAEPVGSR